MPPLSRAARAFAAGTLALSCAAPPPTPSTVIAAADQRSGTTALLIAVSAVDDHVAWASGQDATWLRTRDGGEHWEVGRVPGADSLQFRDVEAFDANEAFLLSIGNGPQSRIYHTADGGAHWTLQFTNADPKGFYDCLGFWDRARGIAIGDAVNDAISLLRT
ncbi:MAG TPA: YCF48-related protein, partial [Gemmatimonadaceae bacterium]|nr:YCF48-related protein [Gemmatimonadaceae bacterium]